MLPQLKGKEKEAHRDLKVLFKVILLKSTRVTFGCFLTNTHPPLHCSLGSVKVAE